MAVSVGIVGAGVSGLALGYHLRRILKQSGAEHELFIYEKSDRVGGSISSGREDGFLIEWGPNGFLNNEQATFELIRDLGLRDRLVVSRDAARKRFILIDGRLTWCPCRQAAP
jgi:protoporphyrinogen/coproporphyrinogen III oxidase